ncbi:hypothetical protein [Pleomorphovibrio marinus]|uniref:hypothetical protein n=1 Tax=Pleomorphovibrio marinus TaxID=2164132 RepID=UPI0018E5672F|nr:hypothetical protein [Pleomorphovibrio marinus]
MKTLLEKFASLLLTLIMVVALFNLANASSNNPNNLLLPVEKKGKYAKLDVSTLPMDREITVRVRDDIDRLVYEFKVKNTGQNHVLVDFNRLKPGAYSLNLIRGDKDVVRKHLHIHWNKVAVSEVISLSRDIGQEDRFPLNLLR